MIPKFFSRKNTFPFFGTYRIDANCYIFTFFACLPSYTLCVSNGEAAMQTRSTPHDCVVLLVGV